MRPIRRFVSVVSLLALMGAPAAAQDSDPQALALGMGIGASRDVVGHPTFYVSHRRGMFVGTLQLSGHGLSRTVPGLFGAGRDQATEAAALVGVAHDVGRRTSVHAQLGVSTVRVHRAKPKCIFLSDCSAWEWPGEKQTTHIGLPLEAAITVSTRRGLGIGLRGFANVNAIESYGGVALDFRFHPIQRR